MTSPITAYFWFTFGVNAFRTLMYIFNLDYVAQVKVSKQGWEDLNIREVMYAYMAMIRNFMCFRASVCIWAATQLEDSPVRLQLAWIATGFDVYLMAVIVQKTWQQKHKPGRVLRHHNIGVPAALQASLVVAGAIGLGMYYQQGM